MTRVLTGGGEAGNASFDGFVVSGATGVQSGATRSGRYAFVFPSVGSLLRGDFPALGSDGLGFRFRMWMRCTGYPSGSAGNLLHVYATNTIVVTIEMGTDGRIRRNGGTWSAVVPTGQWVLFELGCTRSTTFNYTLRVGDTTVESWSASGVVPTNLRFGWSTNPGIPGLRLDDLALNDLTGTAENDWPSRTAGVALSLPKADYADGLWRGPTGTDIPGLFYDRVRFIPPRGVGSPNAGSKQVLYGGGSDITSPNADLELVLQSGLEAGAPAGAVIRMLRAVASIGDNSGSLSYAFVVGLTNPAGSLGNVATLGSPAVGAWPTGWANVGGPHMLGSDVHPIGSDIRVLVGNRGNGNNRYISLVGAMIEADPKPAAVNVLRRPQVMG